MEKRPMWITSRLCCGLGNRLFQITAAIGAAERLNIRPVLFLPAMQKVEHGNFDLLRILCPALEIIYTAPEWNIVSQTPSSTVPEIPYSNLPIVLHGFFQNCENFPSLDNKYLPSLPSIPLPPCSFLWAIHFRFGDYRILPHHQVPGLDKYYYHAITTNIPEGSPLVLFSDNPELLIPISKELSNMGYFPDIFTESDTLKTFQAFASCSGGSICSNSTFAWWAAFFTYKALGPQSTYRAFFPDIWIQGEPPTPITSHKLPFTQTIRIQDLSSSPSLKSFHF